MKTLARITAISSFALTALCAWIGCGTEDPTLAIVQNDYPVIPDGGDASKEITVYRTWYFSTSFVDPVGPGAASSPQRTVLATDTVYAVLAIGWDPSSTVPPTTVIPVRSKTRLSVARGDTLTIHVSDTTFDGNCAIGSPLSQDDANFITQRIFPGDFAMKEYDAKTCTATPLPLDGGGNGGLLDATPQADTDFEGGG